MSKLSDTYDTRQARSAKYLEMGIFEVACDRVEDPPLHFDRSGDYGST